MKTGEIADDLKQADRRLARKIAWATIPLLSILCGIQFIDKFVLNYSAVLGLYDDVDGLTGSQFSLTNSLFFAGYLTMQRVPIAKYLGVLTVFWGVAVGCTALVTRFAHLAVMRVLVGIFEGVVPVSFVLLSMLFRRDEQLFWLSMLFAANYVGMATSGLLGYAIGHMDGLGGLRAWKWLMIIWGSITALLGLALVIFLPDTPKSRWFRLTPQEEQLMDDRIRNNATIKTKRMKFYQIQEALKEPRYYLFVFAGFLTNLQTTTSTTFSAQIIRGMGFSNLNAVLLNVPLGVATAFFLFLSVYLNYRFNELMYIAACISLLSTIAMILLCVLPSGPIQLLGIYISAPAVPLILIEAAVIINVIGFTKKSFYVGSTMVGYSIAQFAGPLLMLEKEAPRYYSGLIVFIVANTLCCCCFLAIRWSYKRENTRRKKLEQEGTSTPPPDNRQELDLTDGEDLHFYYRL
ncbi:major facilitator superfamily domain-containing protein [Fennellomyces sp. T-0311]|nr:major facilitator superfamily domain-containing protein [Fennellomyces sp. T-0311]